MSVINRTSLYKAMNQYLNIDLFQFAARLTDGAICPKCASVLGDHSGLRCPIINDYDNFSFEEQWPVSNFLHALQKFGLKINLSFISELINLQYKDKADS